MRKLLIAISLLIGLAAQSVGASGVLRDGGEALPWPWGTECPFPWGKIQGTWYITNQIFAGWFSFKVSSTWENGTRVIEVSRFNEAGELVATGRGVSPTGDKVIRAAMRPVIRNQSPSYWVLIRTYVEEIDKYSCANDSLVTVVTARPLRATSEDKDVHYIVEKISNTYENRDNKRQKGSIQDQK